MKFSKGEKEKKVVLVFLRRYNNAVSREYLLFVFWMLSSASFLIPLWHHCGSLRSTLIVLDATSVTFSTEMMERRNHFSIFSVLFCRGKQERSSQRVQRVKQGGNRIHKTTHVRLLLYVCCLLLYRQPLLSTKRDRISKFYLFIYRVISKSSRAVVWGPLFRVQTFPPHLPEIVLFLSLFFNSLCDYVVYVSLGETKTEWALAFRRYCLCVCELWFLACLSLMCGWLVGLGFGRIVGWLLPPRVLVRI